MRSLAGFLMKLAAFCLSMIFALVTEPRCCLYPREIWDNVNFFVNQIVQDTD
jgi:hypothetical protein